VIGGREEVMNPENLSSKHCVPCRGGIPPLEEDAAHRLLADVPEWRLEENGTRLVRRFEFQDFKKAIEFVNRVADVAEEEGHHPDIAIHWNKVDLVLWTHKIGGLHENDFILAAKVNALLQEPEGSGAGVAG
jgi:4a-hydroxytetrahydrobiopterin dehydratase